MQIVSLNSIDRVNVSTFVQQKPTGNRIEMSLIYDIFQKVEFTPQEIETYGITYKDDQIFVKQDFVVDVAFSDQQIEMIISLIDLMHENNQLHIQMVPTVRKFDNL